MKTGLVKITGVSQILRNLDKADRKIASAVHRGLVAGGRLLRRESMKIVPVETGALRESCFIRNVGGLGFQADIIVGYTTDYAAYVHEDLSKKHGRAYNAAYGGGKQLRGENQQAKYLEQPAREQRTAILQIIKTQVGNIR